MGAWFIRRLGSMLISLVVISLIQFFIINAVPGRPSKQSGAAMIEGQDSQASFTSEADRKWRASYHLDKPILFNTRPWLSSQEVTDTLKHRLEGPEPIDKVRAAERLDDWGGYAVKHLVGVAANAELPIELRVMAIRRLPSNIQRFKRLRHRDWTVDSPEYQSMLAWNKDVAQEDRLAQEHSLPENDPPLEKVQSTAQWWQAWYEKHRTRFDYDHDSSKIKDFFFDTRYVQYYKNILRGDFGETYRGTRVTDEIFERIPVTLTLNLIAFFFIYLIALPVGVLAAAKRSGLFDVVSTLVLFVLYSLPTYYIGLLLLKYLTSRDLMPDWFLFPVGDWESADYDDMTTWQAFWDRAWHSALPVLCMVYGAWAALSRYARTGLLDIIQSDYVRTARAKGLHEFVVVGKHALRNGALPVLTLLASLLPGLFGGSIIVEMIFKIRGMGLFVFTSIGNQDYAAVAGVLFISAVLVLIGLFIVDFLYTLLDPRIAFD